MKIALVGVNSKYVHTNLAIRKIRAYLAEKGISADIKEFSGSEEPHRVAADILGEKYDCIGFSCYIWNIEYTLKLAEIIKKARPDTLLVFGGPEAEFNETAILSNPFADGVIKGEGEKAFEEIAGGRFEKVMTGEAIPMEEMPFPYSEEDFEDKSRIFYYESSRGCPFSCSYCLSAAEKKVKYRSAEKTLKELEIFAKHNVRLVKFIDRTFNSNLSRSKEILRGILKFDCDTEFHAEIAADTIDDEFIEILSEFPENKLRLEAGLQSSNTQTLKAVNRRCNLEKLAENIKKITENTKVTLHLDLIAGLPEEDIGSFKNSFNFAYELNPHELQLGFLKVLPGTPIAKQAEMCEIKSTDYPPYEIISNKYISFDELALLKDTEAVLDMYHNSGILKESERLFITETPFDFYFKLGRYFRRNGLLGAPHHRTKLFDFIFNYAAENGIKNFEVALARDYLISCKGAPLPKWMGEKESAIKKEILNEILSGDKLAELLPELTEINARARHKYIRAEMVFDRIWLISYPDKKIADITAYFE